VIWQNKGNRVLMAVRYPARLCRGLDGAAVTPFKLRTPAFLDRDQPQTLPFFLQREAHLIAWDEPIEHLGILRLEGHRHSFHKARDVPVLDKNPVDLRGDYLHNALSAPAPFDRRACGHPLPFGGHLTLEPPDLLRPPE
jgi:hypothetical protein